MKKALLLSSIITLSLAGSYAHAFSEDDGATDNVFFGVDAGANLTIGGFQNTFIGHSAGLNTTEGDSNVFLGSQAGVSNTTGDFNVFSGFQTGFSNTTGNQNVFSGFQAGVFNTTGARNVFSGNRAGFANTTGGSNVFSGYQAGQSNTTGGFNVFLGFLAGESNTTGTQNVFSGADAGNLNTTGSKNVFSGFEAGNANTTGNSNVFSGNRAGVSNTTGFNNVFSGVEAGNANTTGFNNVFSGGEAGNANTTGNDNVFLGTQAGFSNTGSNNLFLGNLAGSFETGSNKLYIETSQGNTTPLIYGEFDNDLVGINGILGVGTQLPTSTLHVTRADGSAQVLVEETNASVATRILFELKNNGGVRFDMLDQNTGNNWVFQNQVGTFDITLAGTGTREFRFNPNGNLEISGMLTQSSSRTVKQDIIPVNHQQILDKVLALPIAEWSYIKDAEYRHIGPMAEDFYAAFELGHTNKGLSSVDTGGIALAAIQGLKQKQDVQIDKQNEEIEVLQIKNAALQQQLNELQQLVYQLAAKDQVALVQ